MKYSQQDIAQGLNLRTEAQENPSPFGMNEGATQTTEGRPPKSRMAGQIGQRVIDLMTNPEEQKRTQNWMQQFGMTNEGMQFNQARMMMANPQPQQQEQQ